MQTTHASSPSGPKGRHRAPLGHRPAGIAICRLVVRFSCAGTAEENDQSSLTGRKAHAVHSLGSSLLAPSWPACAKQPAGAGRALYTRGTRSRMRGKSCIFNWARCAPVQRNCTFPSLSFSSHPLQRFRSLALARIAWPSVALASVWILLASWTPVVVCANNPDGRPQVSMFCHVDVSFTTPMAIDDKCVHVTLRKSRAVLSSPLSRLPQRAGCSVTRVVPNRDCLSQRNL